MSIPFWLFIFAAIQAIGSIFAGLQFFGITAGNMKAVSLNKWLVVMLFLWIGSLGISAYGLYSISTYQDKGFTGIQETIRHHTFSNESVEVDGKEFDQCSFENVTFTYRGTGTFKFNKVTFKGEKIVTQTDSKAARGYTELRDFLTSLPGVSSVAHGVKNPDTGEVTVHFNETKIQLNEPRSSQPTPPETRHDPKSRLPLRE